MNFAVAIRSAPASETGTDPERVDLGSVQLFAWHGPADTVNSPDDLRLLFARWRAQIPKCPQGFVFADQVNVNRYGGHSEWATDPCWVCDITELLPNQDSYTAPNGPFFDDATHIFAESIGQLSAQWLHDPSLRHQHAVTHRYRLVLTDRRARIVGLTASNNDLTVGVDALLPFQALRCVANRTGFRGEEEQVICPIADGFAEVHFSGSVKKLDLWVLAADGQWLDRYYEDESRVSWGPSLYNQPRRTTDEPFASLQLALDQGETESVEFKEWIRAVARDGKTIEILKTAVAFANVHGGDIYIGVDDDAQVCGVKDWLNRDYGSRIQASSSEQQDAYVKDLRRLLNDGTTPSTNATFDWIDAAGLLVLRIRIPGGSEGPYALVENGDLYVRRGATNRKARPAELVALRSSGLRS
jgi:hypothetical protein